MASRTRCWSSPASSPRRSGGAAGQGCGRRYSRPLSRCRGPYRRRRARRPHHRPRPRYCAGSANLFDRRRRGSPKRPSRSPASGALSQRARHRRADRTFPPRRDSWIRPTSRQRPPKVQGQAGRVRLSVVPKGSTHGAHARNPGTPLEPDWFDDVAGQSQRRRAPRRHPADAPHVKKEWQAAWLVKAVTCIDLTTLAGDDTPGRVRRLCAKARQPLRHDLRRRARPGRRAADGRRGLRLPDHGRRRR